MLMFDRKHQNSVKQLSFNNNFFNCGFFLTTKNTKPLVPWTQSVKEDLLHVFLATGNWTMVRDAEGR